MDPINRCPACRAPNPKGRDACWSCQAALALPAPPASIAPAATASIPEANPWGMEAYRRTCPECRQVHGIYNRTCPHCGTPNEAGGPISFGSLSRNWERTPTADGGSRIRLTSRARWNVGGGAMAVLVVGLVATGFSLLGAFHGPAYRQGINLIVAVLFAGIYGWMYRDLIPNALYNCLGHEEWHVYRDALEVRRRLFGRETRRSYTQAALSLTAHRVSTGRSRHILARLRLLYGDQPYTLCTRWGRGGIEELEGVGGKLAELTGWPFHVEADAMDLKKPWFWL